MLVLRRRAGEGLVIDGDIHILITEIDKSRVKLCIEAPPEVSVLRDELVPDKRIVDPQVFYLEDYQDSSQEEKSA